MEKGIDKRVLLMAIYCGTAFMKTQDVAYEEKVVVFYLFMERMVFYDDSQYYQA
jgi:hypothetical protein